MCVYLCVSFPALCALKSVAMVLPVGTVAALAFQCGARQAA